MKNLRIGNLVANVPIVQGGMGVGVSLSGLASAVANEGGIGVISSAGLGLYYRNLSSDYIQASILGLKEEIRIAKSKASGIIGVNIMVAMTNFADMVETAISEKIDIIFSGAGLPLDLPKYLTKGSKTKLVPIVSSARATKIICDKWSNLYNYLPDAIVVEGPKAGGHLGYKIEQISNENFTLEHLLPQIVEEVKFYEEKYDKKIPVIAAGGVYTGEDIAKMLELGASGVQMGSRFVTTVECDASEEFKNLYIQAKEEDLTIIQSPVGMPGRAINNEFLDKVKRGETQPKSCPFHCIKTCNIENSPYCIMLALYNAYKGNMDKGYAFAGVNAYRAEKIITVKETFAKIKEEFENYLVQRLRLAVI
ncbi:MAG: nitronate monooxygenase [Bacteroidetes bacterium]|nr:nitronate monooxygenase [Bacteroidota bacterium]